MAPFGLSSSGFKLKRLADIRLELELAFRSIFGDSLDVDPATSIIGQFIGVLAEREALVWELAKAIYDAFVPSSAEGVQLDRLCEITGVDRRPASKSTVLVTCGGTPGTPLAAGRILSVEVTGLRFVSTAAATIGMDGEVKVLFEGQETGAIQAPAGTLTVIETPVSGWSTAVNEVDAEVGDEIETDLELRIRRRESLQIIGAAAVDAIRSRILDEVAGVTDALVYENDTMFTDPEGRPAKSIQVVVAGGEDQAIADKIWQVKAAGIATFSKMPGGVVVPVVDTMDFSHDVAFNRAQDILVWLHIRITVGDQFSSGIAQVDKVTLLQNQVGEDYIITVDNADFSVVGGADSDATLDALVAAINNAAVNGWVPVTASHVTGQAYLILTSDYPGVPFVTTASSTVADAWELETTTQSEGDQANIIQAIVDYAGGTSTQPREQTIGRPVYRSRYFTPINTIFDIQTIEIWTAWGIADPPYKVPNPPPGPGWSQVDVPITPDQLALIDSLRISVEIV